MFQRAALCHHCVDVFDDGSEGRDAYARRYEHDALVLTPILRRRAVWPVYLEETIYLSLIGGMKYIVYVSIRQCGPSTWRMCEGREYAGLPSTMDLGSYNS